MTSPRPTPLVDSLARTEPQAEKINGRFVYNGTAIEVVSAEEARQLERDRAELIEALRVLRDKMKSLDKDLNDVFVFYAAHGMLWRADNNWKAEADDADALLARLEARSRLSARTP